MTTRPVLLLAALAVAACATKQPVAPQAEPAVASDSPRVSLAPYVPADGDRLPLRVCVLAGGNTATAPDYRLYTVTTSGAPATADTTTTTLFYRLVAGADTVRQAWCSLPGAVPVAEAVLGRLKAGDGPFPLVSDPGWSRERRPPTQSGVIECGSDPSLRNCYATETASTAPVPTDLWGFDGTPFVAADSTDYGVPGSGAYTDDPDCLPCKVPSSAFTPVDALSQRLDDDPYFLIRHFGERQ